MKKRSIVENIIIVIAAIVLVYVGYRLFGIVKMYHDTDQLYKNIKDDYTKPFDDRDPNARASEEKPPVDVDWDELKKVNDDVVGWVYVEAIPEISYAIVAADDNDYYLHRDINKNYLYAGCIFVDSNNQKNFTDKATFVYGHNMINESMFGKLKHLKEQETFEKSPYFWILTPNHNYKYEIYSVFDTEPMSRVYQLWGGESDEFLEWEKYLKESSVVKTNAEPIKPDVNVILSTCNHHTMRTVCIGKCVSEDKPRKEYKKYVLSEYMGEFEREEYVKKMARWDLCESITEEGKGLVVKASKDQAENWRHLTKKNAEYLANAFGGAYGGSCTLNEDLTELKADIIENASIENIRDTLSDIMMNMEAYQVFDEKNEDGKWKITASLYEDETGELITRQVFPESERTEEDRLLEDPSKLQQVQQQTTDGDTQSINPEEYYVEEQ